MHLVLRLRGGGPPPRKPEIGIASGGTIKQSIIKDPYPATIWDAENTLSFNVQVLNSELFQEITGSDPPETPITAETYANERRPFFEIYEEKSDIEGKFEAVKSVKAIDKAKAQAKGEEVTDEASVANPVISLNPDGSRLRFTPISVMKEQLQGLNHAQFDNRKRFHDYSQGDDEPYD